LQLSIIIVNYNVKYFLEQCLCSVQKAVTGLDAEVWVVDNASTDGSKEYLSTTFPTVHFIWSSENMGFAKANNLAVQKANGDFILFLNPDTIVAEDSFFNCLQFMQTHTNAGALGVYMIDGSGNFLPESKRGFPSSSAAFYKLSGISRLFPASKTFARYHLGYLSKNETHEVDVLSGAFMMVRKHVLQQTNGFDEDFFMYGEDIDLSYRLQQLKNNNGETYKNYYFNGTTIIHYKGESTQKGSLKYVQLFYKAMLLFVKKHPQQFYNGVFNVLIQLAIAVRGVVSLAGNLFAGSSSNNPPTNETVIAIGTNETIQRVTAAFPSLSIKTYFTTIDEAIPELRGGAVLLLCESEQLRFQQIISITQTFGNRNTIYLHARGSKSIISSTSKNKSGLVITK
jgi:GT2 family glycosyltransferase